MNSIYVIMGASGVGKSYFVNNVLMNNAEDVKAESFDVYEVNDNHKHYRNVIVDDFVYFIPNEVRLINWCRSFDNLIIVGNNLLDIDCAIEHYLRHLKGVHNLDTSSIQIRYINIQK